jgi:hypothetical protein
MFASPENIRDVLKEWASKVDVRFAVAGPYAKNPF